MSEQKLPVKFADLKPTELYRSAIEDFALPVEEEDKNKKKVLLAAFVEGGVNWDDYVSQHPEIKPEVDDLQVEPNREQKQGRSGDAIINPAPVDRKSLSVDNAQNIEPVQAFEPVPEKVVAPSQPKIRVAEKPVAEAGDKFLIKMERKNPTFQTRGYTFTQQNPYNLVNPDDAEYILSKEDGFRQALPSELAEFYG